MRPDQPQSSSPQTKSRARERFPVLRQIHWIVGVALLAFIATQEYSRVFSGPNLDESDSITTIVTEGDGPIDRVQILLCVMLDGPAAPPSQVREWIVTTSEMQSGVELSVESPRFTANLQWDAQTAIQRAQASTAPTHLFAGLFSGLSSDLKRSNLPYSQMTVGSSGATEVDIALGDQRTFSRVSTVIGSGPLALRGSQDRCRLFVRPLHSDDSLGSLPAAKAIDHIGETLRATGTLMAKVSSVDGLPSSSIGRVMSEGHPIGVIILLVGLTLVMHSRISLLRGAAFLLTAWIVSMSLAARVDLNAQISRLDSEDPGVRAAAVGRLAASEAFAPSAAEALGARFDIEEDPAVRAAIVHNLNRGLPIQSLPTAGELLLDAEHDPDPVVQNAVARYQNRGPNRGG